MVAACPYPTTQGTQVYLRGLSRALVEAGHEVHLVVYHFGEELEPCGATLHRTPRLPGYSKLRAGPAWGKPLLDALLLAELLRVVRDVEPDLIHAHNYEAPIAAYIARRLSSVPVLYTSHNFMVDELHTYFGSRFSRALARRFARLLDSQLPRRADQCIALSAEAVPVLEELGLPATRIHTIPPGVHPDDFPEEESPGRSAAPLRVAYAGNPDNYQDLDLLFGAMKRLREHLPEVRLRLISSADLSSTAERALALGLPRESLELVTTTDWPEVRAALRGAQVAALPRSVCRGFPIKLLNYMGLGMPVVACAGSAKLLRNGTDGLVVPFSEEAFADGLLRLLEDPGAANRMGRSARASVLEKHGWTQRVPDLERVYAAMV